MANTITTPFDVDEMIAEFDKLSAAKDKKAPSPKVSNQRILAALEALGGQRVHDDALTFEGDKIVLPKQYEGRIQQAIDHLHMLDEELNQQFEVDREFDYHPYDVANSFQRVLKAVYGTTGIGAVTHSLFGSAPPKYISVTTSPTETVQVPWGKVQLPPLDATFQVGYSRSRHGVVGYISALLPKRHRAAVEGLYRAIEADLANHSLYRGKAIDAGWMDAEFLDLTGIDESKVVYSANTLAQIAANVWSVVEHADEIVDNGMQLKRAVLLYGPYGTGKSLTGYVTAQKAVAHGWTFVYCRPGQSLEHAFHAAKLYAPSVVFFEDLDVIADSGDTAESNRVSKLLDMFDGISNKTTPVVAVLTTNHVDRLHRGMLRPGRLDAVIHIGELDAAAIEKLIRSVIPAGRLAANIEWGPVTEAMQGFLPAFIKEATERALRYAIARGDKNAAIATEDLVHSAEGLRPQLDLMTGANEHKEPDTLSSVVTKTIRDSMQGAVLADYFNPDEKALVVQAAQG